MSNDKALAVRTDDAFVKALEPASFDAALRCAEMVHKVGICGVKSAEDALIRMMAGRAQGLCAIDSLRLVHVIHGRPSFDATFIRAKCLQLPACEYFEPVPGECTDRKATFRAKRKGREEQRLSFTIEDAQRANLQGKDNYKQWPAAMLAARATTALARLIFPEAVAGMYTPDEVEDAIDAVGVVVPDLTPAQYDELTGEVVMATAHADVIDHAAVVANLKAEIDAARASGDAQHRRAVVERIRTSDLPSTHLDDVRDHYKAAFKGNGVAAQQGPATPPGAGSGQGAGAP